MDNTKLLNDIRDVIIDWLVPHMKHATRLGSFWSYDSNADAFCWGCYADSSVDHSYIGVRFCDDTNDIIVWTNSKDNATIVIHLVKRKAFIGLYSVDVVFNTVAEFDDFSEEEMKDLYNQIIDFYKDKHHAVILSEEELSDQCTTTISIREGRVISEKTLERLKGGAYD